MSVNAYLSVKWQRAVAAAVLSLTLPSTHSRNTCIAAKVRQTGLDRRGAG